MELYARLEARLGELGLSFYRLTTLTGIPQGHFSHWKKGKRKPSDDELRRLASVADLELSYAELLGWMLVEEYGYETVKSAVEAVSRERRRRSPGNHHQEAHAEAS